MAITLVGALIIFTAMSFWLDDETLRGHDGNGNVP
jgi:hypothetical protein